MRGLIFVGNLGFALPKLPRFPPLILLLLILSKVKRNLCCFYEIRTMFYINLVCAILTKSL